MNRQNNFKRVIYRNNRYTLEFFMYDPSILISKKSRTIKYNPILQLRYLNPKTLTEQFDHTVYKITPRNIYRVVKFLNKVIKWFYDKDKNDLFFRNTEGKLIFNADYKDLHAELTPQNKYDSGYLKAIPVVLEYGEKTLEGIYLYINKIQNVIALSYEELELLFNLLNDFSFQEEIIADLLSYNYAKINGNIEYEGTRWNTPQNTDAEIPHTAFD